MSETGWFGKLKEGLSKTRAKLNETAGPTLGAPVGQALGMLTHFRAIDEELLDELEASLILADCGPAAAAELVEGARVAWRRDRLETADQLRGALIQGLAKALAPLERPLEIPAGRPGPFVVLLCGVNGAGKTTTIGKLARQFQSEGKSVLLAAGDTFRAAAVEQLQAWGERSGLAVVSSRGADPSSVIFDGVKAAMARGIDVVIADTAGRLPTQPHLMEELAKAKRVAGKALAGAPHEVLLVLDSTVGQNALSQLAAFDKAVGVTGLVVTKLDGSAKGGVLAALATSSPKPVRFIGVGEGVDDLQPFSAEAFARAMFEADSAGGASG